MTAVIRPGAGALERVDHDQEFHDRLVDRVVGRLDEEDVLLADVLQDLDEDVLVGELEDLQLARLGAEIAADLPGEVRVRVAVVDLELVRVQARRLPSAERRVCSHTDLIRQAPGSVGLVPLAPEPSAPGAPSSPMPSCSASPARNAAMATTRSPSARRMTMTPRACGE